MSHSRFALWRRAAAANPVWRLLLSTITPRSKLPSRKGAGEPTPPPDLIQSLPALIPGCFFFFFITLHGVEVMKDNRD